MPPALTDAHYSWAKRFTGIDVAAGASSPVVRSVQDMDDDLQAYEDGTPLAPMALPELTAKEKAAQEKASRERATREKADNARKRTRMHSPDFVHGIVLTSRVNRANYKLMIADVCEKFADYADDKVKEFQATTEASDVFGEMLKEVVGLVVGKLGEKVGEALGEAGGKLATKLWGKIQGALEANLGKGIEAHFAGKGEAGLRAAIKAITNGAKDASAAMDKAVKDGIETTLTDIEGRLSGSGNVLESADASLLDDFVGKNLDVVLERFGVPNEGSAKNVKVAVYGKMVKSFEKQLIVARHFAMGLDAGSIEDREVDHNAQLHADAAVEAMQKHDSEAPPATAQ